MGRKICSLAVCSLLFGAWLGYGTGPLLGDETREEGAERTGYQFTLQNTEDGQLGWGIKLRGGGRPDVTREEERAILEEEIFPDVLREAKEGVPKAVWQVGMFHLDGVGTPQDTEKAKAAFREVRANSAKEGSSAVHA